MGNGEFSGDDIPDLGHPFNFARNFQILSDNISKGEHAERMWEIVQLPDPWEKVKQYLVLILDMVYFDNYTGPKAWNKLRYPKLFTVLYHTPPKDGHVEVWVQALSGAKKKNYWKYLTGTYPNNRSKQIAKDKELRECWYEISVGILKRLKDHTPPSPPFGEAGMVRIVLKAFKDEYEEEEMGWPNAKTEQLARMFADVLFNIYKSVVVSE